MKMMFKDLPCYQNLTDEQKGSKSYYPNKFFDLSRYPKTPIRSDFAAFVFDRSEKISYSSLIREKSAFNLLGDFLSKKYPDLEHITDVELSDLIKKLKAFLLKKNRALSYERKRLDRDTISREENPVIAYLKKAYDYFLPKMDDSFNKENDIWLVDTLPFPVDTSPVHGIKSISFTRIKQEKIRAEIKEAALYSLKRVSLSYVVTQVYSATCLSEFLSKEYPLIRSLKDFNRELLEEYLTYLYLECKRKSDYRTELQALKSILNTTGRLQEYDNLRGIFLKSDFSKQKRTIFKSYSDSELKKLHEAYIHLDKQTARLLIIHESLGLRISDTLTIKKDDVDFENMSIKIRQEKTDNSLIKKLNPNLCLLLRASIDETTKAHGRCSYIFSSKDDPDKPLSYNAVTYRLNTLFHKLDLRDDNGNLFTAKTHIFRHTYGKKLCDLFNDDATISALLGHKSISSVSFYRQMSPKTLAESVKPVIDQRNEKIKQFKKGWML